MEIKPPFVILTDTEDESGFYSMFGHSAEVVKDDDGNITIKVKNYSHVPGLKIAAASVKEMQRMHYGI